MKYFTVLVFSLVLTGFVHAAASGSDIVSHVAEMPRHEFTLLGRWFQRPAGTACSTTITQGSELRFEVEGAHTASLLTFTPTLAERPAELAVSVDGGAFRRLAVPLSDAPRAVTVADGLTAGRHAVRVVVAGVFETAPVWKSGAGVTLCGVQTDAGSARRVPTHGAHILFIGDSITAGIVAYGHAQAPDPASIPLNGGGEVSYAHVAADLLDATPSFDAFGGTGVTVAGSGGVPDAQTHAFSLMDGLPASGESPDLIQIYLGVNDGRQGVAPEAFQAGYVRLVRALQQAHPGAIIALLPPFTGSRALAGEVRAVAAQTGVHLIETRDWQVSTVDGVHPDVAGHAEAGRLDAQSLRAILPVRLGGTSTAVARSNSSK